MINILRLATPVRVQRGRFLKMQTSFFGRSAYVCVYTIYIYRMFVASLTVRAFNAGARACVRLFLCVSLIMCCSQHSTKVRAFGAPLENTLSHDGRSRVRCGVHMYTTHTNICTCVWYMRIHPRG